MILLDYVWYFVIKYEDLIESVERFSCAKKKLQAHESFFAKFLDCHDYIFRDIERKYNYMI